MTRVMEGGFIVYRELRNMAMTFKFTESCKKKIKNLAKRLSKSQSKTVEEAIELLDKKLRRKK
jgi:predicted DNA-binding protein